MKDKSFIFKDPGADLAGFIDDKALWSRRVFGDEITTTGIVNHIRKELIEIEEKPNDIVEYIDVIFLALDGASRAGYSGKEIVAAWRAKHAKNLSRRWEKTKDGHSEHVRDGEEKE